MLGQIKQITKMTKINVFQIIFLNSLAAAWRMLINSITFEYCSLVNWLNLVLGALHRNTVSFISEELNLWFYIFFSISTWMNLKFLFFKCSLRDLSLWAFLATVYKLPRIRTWLDVMGHIFLSLDDNEHQPFRFRKENRRSHSYRCQKNYFSDYFYLLSATILETRQSMKLKKTVSTMEINILHDCSSAAFAHF